MVATKADAAWTLPDLSQIPLSSEQATQIPYSITLELREAVLE
jgi:hypothetical protein